MQCRQTSVQQLANARAKLQYWQYAQQLCFALNSQPGRCAVVLVSHCSTHHKLSSSRAGCMQRACITAEVVGVEGVGARAAGLTCSTTSSQAKRLHCHKQQYRAGCQAHVSIAAYQPADLSVPAGVCGAVPLQCTQLTGVAASLCL